MRKSVRVSGATLSEDERALIERVATGFIDGSVVPIIGAGCSASQRNEAGRTVDGFPRASEFAQMMQGRYRYLKGSRGFYDINVLLERREGPGMLIDELVRTYSPAKALPSYEALAVLPFDTAVSFNFDESLERSLLEAGRTPSLVIGDEDVPLSRGAPVKVVKPHGTASRGPTLRATRSRVGEFENECPLVRSLLEVLLAGRTGLYVGYGFGDEDLLGAVRRVRTWSRGSFRHSTAIVLSASAALKAELDKLNIDVMEGTAVEVLGAIAAEFVERHQMGPEDSERWRAHPFFRELIAIRGRPTETQVIEALLNATENRQYAAGVRQAVRQSTEAARLCLTYRPNFGGLERVQRELKAIAERESDEAAWEHWRGYRENRRAARSDIFSKASPFLRGVKRVLVFSQSQRVIELLLDLEPRQRSRIRLIVPECRAKSPEPFQNAFLIAERLEGGDFKSIQFVADVVGFHLIVNGEVDAVLMGVHKAYKLRDGAEPIAILNAVGTQAMCVAAKEADVPVAFVLEDEKIVLVDSLEQARDSANFDPECDISRPLDTRSRGLASVTFRQVGYDFVPWRSNMLAFVGRVGK
jgi:translation initiation factor 2B subunit (eIF-2B alpha/beta/delta family)